MVHFAVEQHLAGVEHQVLRPHADKNGANDAHDRIEPGPAVEPATGERGNGQDRSRGIGNDVDVRRLQVQVAVMMVIMSCVMIVPVAMIMVIVRFPENHRADQVDDQADRRNDSTTSICYQSWAPPISASASSRNAIAKAAR